MSTFPTAYMNLEVKPSTRDVEVAHALVQMLRHRRHRGEMIISSRSLYFLRTLQHLDAHRELGKIGFVSRPHAFIHLESIHEHLKLDMCNVHPDYRSFPFSNHWVENPVPEVWVWGLETPRRWERMLKHRLPVTGMLVNDPADFRNFLKSKTSPADGLEQRA